MIFLRSRAAFSGLVGPMTPNIWMIGAGNRSFASKASPAYRRMMKRKADALVAANPARVPTLEDVKDLPLGYQQMDNASLAQLASIESNHAARSEFLRRHIMGVDNVCYEEASKTFDKIAHYNDRGLFFMALPYEIGIVSSLTAAFASFPLVFHEPTVHYFNEFFVTADIPDPKDLETFLEVGSWSWNWMEPCLGQVSFVLLCLQFARGQMQNLGVRPYTRFLKQKRAERLAVAFPQYDRKVIMDYSKSDNFMVGSK